MRNLANHSAADDGEGEVPGHKVCPGISDPRAASIGKEDDENLGHVGAAREEQCHQSIETEALDDDGTELY